MCYSFFVRAVPEEKRHITRINLKVPIRYQIRGKHEFNDTLCDNIGLGGIGFIDNKFLTPKTLLMLEINAPLRTLRPIGKIAWITMLPHSDNYQIGVEFLEFNPEEKHYLADYINMEIDKGGKTHNGS